MNIHEAEARIKLLSDEIDANDEENRLMQEEIDGLYKLIHSLKKPPVTAVYTNRHGAGCVRVIDDAADAKKILTGGYYGVREVVLLDPLKKIVGRRQKKGNRWTWFIDLDYFD